MELQIEKLRELHNIYVDDDYVLHRLDSYIMKLLPAALTQAKNTNIERTSRRDRLTAQEDMFTDQFLSRNRYYYCQRPELFIHYDGKHFKGYSEDDIQHQLLSKITQEQRLVPWKQKVKNNIMKQIKDRSPLGETPESATIQSVLDGLWPTCFSTRNGAKHFLTAVGDCIRGNRTLVYIIHPRLKELVAEIEHAHYAYFGGANILSSFKLKYHGHDYSTCRFFQMTQTKQKYRVTLDLSRHIMDLMCVAVHYSHRYTSSDNLLKNLADASLRNLSLYVSGKTPSDVVDDFIKKSISQCNGGHIKSKNMYFIWKKFLDNINIPNVMFYDKLSSLFKEKLNYDNKNHQYIDVTSTYLPEVARFIEFWDTNMIEDSTGIEIEIDELLTLYSKSPTSRTSDNITDEFVSELIHNIYPDVVVDESKYICGMKCVLWDKVSDVETFIELCKASGTTFNSLYDGYAQYANNGKELKMSKRCFEKICNELIGKFINEHGEIDVKLWV